MWDRFERRGSENDTNNNNNNNKSSDDDDDNDDNTDRQKHYTIYAKQQQTHNASNVAWFIAKWKEKKMRKMLVHFSWTHRTRSGIVLSHIRNGSL